MFARPLAAPQGPPAYDIRVSEVLFPFWGEWAPWRQSTWIDPPHAPHPPQSEAVESGPVLVGTVVWALLLAPGRPPKQPSVEICEGDRGMDPGQAAGSSVSLTISKALALEQEGNGLRWILCSV